MRYWTCPKCGKPVNDKDHSDGESGLYWCERHKNAIDAIRARLQSNAGTLIDLVEDVRRIVDGVEANREPK